MTLVEIRAREDGHFAIARGFVEVALLLDGDVAKLCGENAAMNGVVTRGWRLLAQIFAEGVAELLPDIAPFLHAGEGEEVRFAELSQPIARSARGFWRGVPDLEQRDEVGLRRGEGFVRGAGEFAFFFGAFARIGDAKTGGDDEQFRQGFFSACLQQHATQGGIQRQAGEFAAKRRELVRFVEGAELVEQIVASANGGADGRIDKGEVFDLAELVGLHAQDDFGEVRALNLRHGEAVPLLKILLRVQADADAVLHAASTASTLIGAAL